MQKLSLFYSAIALLLAVSCYGTPADDLQLGLANLDAQLIQQAIQAGAAVAPWQGRWEQPVLAGFRAQVQQLGSAEQWSVTDVAQISALFSKLHATLLTLRQAGIKFDWEVDQQMSFQDRWNLQFPFLRDQIQQYQARIKLLSEAHQALAQKLIAQILALHELINNR